MNTNKRLTIGIPAFKAQEHIEDCLCSIYIQTIRNYVEVIIAADDPDDDYNYLKDKFPKLDIKVIPCKENTGPGLARQRALDNATTNWITFIDADDVFMTPIALEQLMRGIYSNVMVVQGTFYEEVMEDSGRAIYPKKDNGHAWVFGRLYNIKFIKNMGIEFSELRAMEDGEFNSKVFLSVEKTGMIVNLINEPIYLWRHTNEDSITNSNKDEKGIPQYNFDLCYITFIQSNIRTYEFYIKKFQLDNLIIEIMLKAFVTSYFKYNECLNEKPIFAEQMFFYVKRFYHEVYKEIENLVSDEELRKIYLQQESILFIDSMGIIPSITFKDFLERVKSEKYGGKEELERIRSKLSKEILENDLKTKVALW